MTKEEFETILTDIASNLDKVEIVTERLQTLRENYDLLVGSDKSEEIENLKKEIESLKEKNYNLFMRVTSDDDSKKIEMKEEEIKDDDNKENEQITIYDLFEEGE